MAVVTFVLSLVFAHICWAAASSSESCKELSQELDSMRTAQNKIMMSLVKNHESFADQLGDLSDEIGMSSGRPSPAVLKSMKKSAEAYRVRGTKGATIAEGLDASSMDLINRVKKCLK